jgi:hypothetical protein
LVSITTETYIFNVIEAIQVRNEIENNSTQIFINKEEIEDWLKRHAHFYWSNKAIGMC